MKNNIATIKEKMSKIMFWGVCFILFLPIIVLPPTLQPSEWSRTILFRITLTILASFIFYKYFYKKETSFSIPKWKNPVYLPFLILVAFSATLILATIFSEDIRFSFFSSPNRAGGLLNSLFYLIFTIFLAIFIKENDWKKLWKWIFSVGILASLMAIVQYFNLLKNLFVSYSGAPPSLLGNSTFLAIYILFLAFLSFVFLIQEKEKKKKIVYAVIFSIFLITILITGSRATYLGILIGLFYFFLFYPKKLKTLKIITIAFLVSVCLFVAYVNISPKLPNFIENNTKISYFIHNRLSVKMVFEDLFRTRLSVWQITINTIKEKPLFGWGPENFYIGFEKYYEPNSADLQKLWWDRPHNIFLDVASHSGLFSLFFYIAFWITLFWNLQKFKKRETDEQKIYLAHGLQTMFIGYLITLFFNFDSFSTYLISFFFVGYSFYLISSQGEKYTILPPQNKNLKILQKKSTAILLLVLAVIFIWFWNIKPLYLNEEIVHANSLANMKKCDQAISTMDKIWNKNFILKSYSGLIYADVIKTCAVAPDKEIEYSKKALNVLKTTSEIKPKFTRTWLFMGIFTNVLAAREENIEQKNKLLSESMSYLEKALSLSPKRQEVFEEIDKNHLIAKDYQAMKKTSNDCINMDSNQGICYWYLGIAEIFLGDQENGKKHIEESLRKRDFVPAYIQLGAAYLSQNNYKDAVNAYRNLVTDYPKNASYHAVFALLLRETGDYAGSSKEALKVLELQPENEESMQFLQILLSLSPNDPIVHTSMAFAYRELGNEEMALKEFNTAKYIYLQLIKTKPNILDYHHKLAGVYKGLKEYEKAYQEAFSTFKIEPNNEEWVGSFMQGLPSEFWNRYIEESKLR